MRKTTFVALVYLQLLVAYHSVSADANTPHAVTGQVFDSSGSPVSGALVASVPTDTTGSAGSIAWVPTGSKGTFRLILKPGRYIIRAKYEAIGYPDPTFLLSSDPNADFPEVSVAESDVSSVRVRLGGRGGIVEGDLRDSNTQHTISGGKVTIRDAHNSESYVEVFTDQAGHFQFTVPSKPVQLVATAPGYKTTVFNMGHEITLSEGEHRTTNLELQPQCRPAQGSYFRHLGK
ncbi:MAG: carboxypeptidase-like regulatory domain-containing protein [Acidobacteriia bacterium]|nr:carboxypeptidase-like regulatory domain-containing protein [Terriglobia bacterium]